MPDTERPSADQRAGRHGRAGFNEDLDDAAGYDEEPGYGWQGRSVNSADARAGRRYRPGRGGFDPEAAALAARTKYARRQRIVLAGLLAAIGTAVLAALAVPQVWWAHAAIDLLLVGYLAYLRKQVRIEDEVRRRRLARLSDDDRVGDSEWQEYDDYGDEPAEDSDYDGDYDEFDAGWDGERDDYSGGRYARPSRDRSTQEVAAPRDGSVLDIDDEDPMFDELDERTWEPYRRAAGE